MIRLNYAFNQLIIRDLNLSGVLFDVDSDDAVCHWVIAGGCLFFIWNIHIAGRIYSLMMS